MILQNELIFGFHLLYMMCIYRYLLVWQLNSQRIPSHAMYPGPTVGFKSSIACQMERSLKVPYRHFFTNRFHRSGDAVQGSSMPWFKTEPRPSMTRRSRNDEVSRQSHRIPDGTHHWTVGCYEALSIL